MSSKKSDEFEAEMGAILKHALRRSKEEEDFAMASALDLAEDAHGAFRALAGLIADHDAKSGERGPLVRGVWRNDMASLLGVVNERLGQAVKQARHAGRGAPIAAPGREEPKSGKAPVRTLRAVARREDEAAPAG